MPYRHHDAVDLRERLVPRLRPASDPTEGLRRPLLPEEASLEAPWVHLALDDGSVPSEEDLRRELGPPQAAFEAAIANLDPSAVTTRDVDGVVVYQGELAAELLLCADFLERLHEDASARTLFVSIPERGLLLAADQRLGREALERARSASGRTYAEPLTSWVLRVERGRLRGRAPAEAPPAPRAKTPRFAAAAPVDRSADRPRPAPLPRRDPDWMPRSLAGRLSLFVVALGALMMIGALRGAMNRPREITLPDPAALRSIEASNDAFERGVAAVEVEARETERGTELTLTSPVDEPNALMHIVERARREAADRASDPSLFAIHLRPTRAQAGESSEDELRELMGVIQRGLREGTRRPTLQVTITVAG